MTLIFLNWLEPFGVHMGQCSHNTVCLVMEVQAESQPRRNRCGSCRQLGHNRGSCPHTTLDACRLCEAFNREKRQERLRLQRLRQERYRTIQIESDAMVVTRSGSAVRERKTRSGPTVRERKIQEILFDNAQMLPDGLYKELMDALVISDWTIYVGASLGRRRPAWQWIT
jgi:hypothetical protein